MTSVQERLKLKRQPTDVWSIFEQLCLASSVLKSGDQNWSSVSRSLKAFVEKSSVNNQRPPDWYSSKACAQQYAYLLEKAEKDLLENPKRKKRDRGETTCETIVRQLSQERIQELNRIMSEQQDDYAKVKSEYKLLVNGTISEEKLQKMADAIEEEERKENEQKARDIRPPPLLNIQSIPKDPDETGTPDAPSEGTVEEEEKKKGGRSPLLTSLLQSTIASPIIQTTHAASPATSSFLSVTKAVAATSTVISSQPITPGPSTSNIHYTNKPVTSTPTLSMLLEQPSTSQTYPVLEEKIAKSTLDIREVSAPEAIVTEKSDNVPDIKIQEEDDSHNSQTESVEDDLTEVLPKDIGPIDKDEISQIIGDIEEIISEDIKNPQTLDSSQSSNDLVTENNDMCVTPIVERSEPRNIDEALSNSPSSEIAIEIDSSTSNIAEIIGTAIETLEPKFKNSETSANSENTEPINTTVQTQITENKKTSHEKESDSIDNESIKHQTPKKLDNNENFGDIIKDLESVIDKNNSDNSNTMDESEKCSEESNEKKVELENTNNTEDDCKQDMIKSISLHIEIDDNTPEEIKQKLPTEHIHINSEQIESNLNENSEQKEEKEAELEIDSKEEKVSQLTIDPPKNKLAHSSEDTIGTDHCDELENELTTEKIQSEIEEREPVEEIKTVIGVEDETQISPSTEIKKDEDIKTQNNEIVKEKSEKKESDVFTMNEIIEKKCDSDSERPKNEELKNEISQKESLTSNTEIESITKSEKEENEEIKESKEDIKINSEIEAIKNEASESVGSTEDLEDDEPSFNKTASGRAVKTYSKKQNMAIDSENESESSIETAEYRAWKKSMLVLWESLVAHKNGSLFNKPVTEENAPGYHSIVKRPMDLLSIKKNIDNGTIRSTANFQRDVMLMFQNALMYNKEGSHIHKMTLEMQTFWLELSQKLLRETTGETHFKRETRTAANSNEDTIIKRKYGHLPNILSETESPRMKKRRKSEND